MVTLETDLRRDKDLDRLSERERSILDLAVKGYKDRAIAEKLGISKGTVGTYWTRIRRKMGPVTRAEIAAIVGRAEGSNSDGASAKLAELCERFDAETARRRAAERYLHLLRRMVTAVARYTVTGRRVELVVGAPESFEPIDQNLLAFCNKAREVETKKEPANFGQLRIFFIAAGEVLVALMA